MQTLDELMDEHFSVLERFVKFKIGNLHDAEDIIQDVCLSATESFGSLKNPASFKPWLIGIARHKCNDYYRRKAGDMCISLDNLSEIALGGGRLGMTTQSVVRDTLDALGEKDKQILYLYYFKNLSQKDIAARLSIPLGTSC